MGARSWPWLKARVLALVTRPGTRTHYAHMATIKPQGVNGESQPR